MPNSTEINNKQFEDATATAAHAVGGAFTGFVPQMVPDIKYIYICVSLLYRGSYAVSFFFVCVCVFFFVKSREGADRT